MVAVIIQNFAGAIIFLVVFIMVISDLCAGVFLATVSSAVRSTTMVSPVKLANFFLTAATTVTGTAATDLTTTMVAGHLIVMAACMIVLAIPIDCFKAAYIIFPAAELIATVAIADSKAVVTSVVVNSDTLGPAVMGLVAEAVVVSAAAEFSEEKVVSITLALCSLSTTEF